jgi:hypothetical protein
MTSVYQKRTRQQTPPHYRIFTEDDLRDAFGKFGNITHAWTAKNPPGFAFIEFDDQHAVEEAKNSMDGQTLMNRTIRVDYARQRNDGGGCCRRDENADPATTGEHTAAGYASYGAGASGGTTGDRVGVAVVNDNGKRTYDYLRQVQPAANDDKNGHGGARPGNGNGHGYENGYGSGAGYTTAGGRGYGGTSYGDNNGGGECRSPPGRCVGHSNGGGRHTPPTSGAGRRSPPMGAGSGRGGYSPPWQGGGGGGGGGRSWNSYPAGGYGESAPRGRGGQSSPPTVWDNGGNGSEGRGFGGRGRSPPMQGRW